MNKELDWPRIVHLMKIGIAAALMVLAGDMLLGWGMHDAAKTGMEGESMILWFGIMLAWERRRTVA